MSTVATGRDSRPSSIARRRRPPPLPRTPRHPLLTARTPVPLRLPPTRTSWQPSATAWTPLSPRREIPRTPLPLPPLLKKASPLVRRASSRPTRDSPAQPTTLPPVPRPAPTTNWGLSKALMSLPARSPESTSATAAAGPARRRPAITGPRRPAITGPRPPTRPRPPRITRPRTEGHGPTTTPMTTSRPAPTQPRQPLLRRSKRPGMMPRLPDQAVPPRSLAGTGATVSGANGFQTTPMPWAASPPGPPWASSARPERKP